MSLTTEQRAEVARLAGEYRKARRIASRLRENDEPALELNLRVADLVRQVGEACGDRMPTAEEVREAVLGMVKLAPAKRGMFVPLVRPRKGLGRTFGFWMDWHAGRTGGSLWGVMMRPRNEEHWSTYVMVGRTLQGLSPSRAGDLWAGALGLGQASE